MSNEQKQKMKECQKEYRKNTSDELKQKYKKNRNNKMTDEQKQKIKDYQRQYKKNMSDEQKQRYKENKRNKDIKYKNLNSGKIIITIIKDNNHFNDVIKL